MEILACIKYFGGGGNNQQEKGFNQLDYIPEKVKTKNQHNVKLQFCLNYDTSRQICHLPRPPALSWCPACMDRLSAWEDELRGDNGSCFTTGKGPAADGVRMEYRGHKKGKVRKGGQHDAEMWDKVKSVSRTQELYSPTFLWSIHCSPIWLEGILPWSKPWAGLCNCTGVP